MSEDSPLKNSTFRISEDLEQEVDSLVYRSGCLFHSRSQLIRVLLREWVKQERMESNLITEDSGVEA